VECAALEARSMARRPAVRAVGDGRGGQQADPRRLGFRDPDDVTGTFAFVFEEAAPRGADLVAIHT
jgi:hypothetical protein